MASYGREEWAAAWERTNLGAILDIPPSSDFLPEWELAHTMAPVVRATSRKPDLTLVRRLHAVWSLSPNPIMGPDAGTTDYLDWSILKKSFHPRAWSESFTVVLLDKAISLGHPGIRGRFLEAVWQGGHQRLDKRLVGQKMIQSYADWSGVLLKGSPPASDGFVALAQARRVAVRMDCGPLLKAVDKEMELLFEKFSDERPLSCLSVVEVMLASGGKGRAEPRIGKQALLAWHDHVLTIAEELDSVRNKVNAVEIAERLGRLLPNPRPSRFYGALCVKHYEEAARKKLATPDRALAAVVLLQDCLKVAEASGLPRQDKNRISDLLRDAAAQASSHMTSVPTQWSISVADVEAFRRQFDEIATANPAAACAVAARAVIDGLEEVRDAVKHRGPSFLSTVTTVSLDGDRCSGPITDDRLADMEYTKHALMRAIAFFRPVVLSILADHGELLCTSLQSSPACSGVDLSGVSAGLSMFAAKNHLAAAYTLAPQVEMLLRNWVRLTGGRRTALRRGTQKEATLHALVMELAATECKREAAWLERMISSPEGYNLRNNLLHGITPPGEIREEHVVLLLQAIFLIPGLPLSM